jgi:hypothetical protein
MSTSRTFGATARSNMSIGARRRCSSPQELERLRSLSRHSFIDMVGKRFGMWVVLRQDSNTDRRGTKWICSCDCGNIRSLWGHTLRCGRTKSCGCNPVWSAKTGAAISKFLYRYKKGAELRGISWNLTIEEFAEIVALPCYYTGEAPSMVIKARGAETIKVNGIDRLDSDKGYCRFNCVACSPEVNRMKGALSESEFFALISKISRHRGKP